MGVHGLTTYVEGNRNFLKDVKFRDSRLVIDGCSLFFRLYLTHGLDQQHGGDYDAFACLLTQFLSALQACNIQPYVVLDGGMDPSDKKFSTLRQRLQSKIKEADNLSHGRNGSVLPILTRNVFIQVLIHRGVPLAQCPAEADWEIACLARQWNCPVLTYDSDFYIFDLPGGYLPLRFFQWANLNGKASNRYISARCYTTNGLCHRFGGMNRELLPLCAVLMGNDYGTPKDAETLLALLDVNTSQKSGGKGKGPTSRIEGLLLWLSAFSSPAEALEEVSRLMGGEGGRSKRCQKGGLCSQLLSRMQEYHITSSSSLAQWFSGGKIAPGGCTSGLAKFPEWLSRAAGQGLLSPLVVDALVMRRVLLMPQVENSKLPSSHCSAKTIRQSIYGVLQKESQDCVGLGGSTQQQRGTGGAVEAQGMKGERGRRGIGRGRGRGGGGRGIDLHTQLGPNAGRGIDQAAGGNSAHAPTDPICVEELDRLELNLKKNQVEAHSLRFPVCLDTIGQASVAVRLNMLLDVLEVRESSLAAVPIHLRLSVAVTSFWLRAATPTPSQHHLQAMVLGLVYGELTCNDQPSATHYQYAASQINWAAERGVWARLDRHRVRPGERRGLDIGVAHSFSQWQACLFSVLCFNQLLLLPLPEPQLSGVFSGTLVHGLLRFLKGGGHAESLLAGGSLSGQLYSSLLDAVKNCSSKAHPSSSAEGRGKRGRGRGRGGRGRVPRGGGQGTGEINKFALLMIDESSDDDW